MIFFLFFFRILFFVSHYLELGTVCCVSVGGSTTTKSFNRSIVRQIIVCVKFSIDRFMQSLYHMKSQAIYHQLPLAIRAVFIKYPLLEYHHVTLHFLIKTFMSHSYEPYHHITIRPMFGWRFLTTLNGIRYTKVKYFQYQSYNRHWAAAIRNWNGCHKIRISKFFVFHISSFVTSFSFLFE